MRCLLVANIAAIAASLAVAGSASASVAWNRWNSNISWRWVSHPVCETGTACWKVDVKSRRGCPNGLYVSLNILKSGRVVDFTNDILDTLRRGRVARMTLTTYRNGHLTGRLTKIRCY